MANEHAAHADHVEPNYLAIMVFLTILTVLELMVPPSGLRQAHRWLPCWSSSRLPKRSSSRCISCICVLSAQRSA